MPIQYTSPTEKQKLKPTLSASQERKWWINVVVLSLKFSIIENVGVILNWLPPMKKKTEI